MEFTIWKREVGGEISLRMEKEGMVSNGRPSYWVLNFQEHSMDMELTECCRLDMTSMFVIPVHVK